jgi:Fe-S cluster biosynthesis and repair protein YggX
LIKFALIINECEKKMARLVNCVKLGKEAEGLDFAPYPGELGEKDFRKCIKRSMG